jgi:hypothetical protein
MADQSNHWHMILWPFQSLRSTVLLSYSMLQLGYRRRKAQSRPSQDSVIYLAPSDLFTAEGDMNSCTGARPCYGQPSIVPLLVGQYSAGAGLLTPGSCTTDQASTGRIDIWMPTPYHAVNPRASDLCLLRFACPFQIYRLWSCLSQVSGHFFNVKKSLCSLVRKRFLCNAFL